MPIGPFGVAVVETFTGGAGPLSGSWSNAGWGDASGITLSGSGTGVNTTGSAACSNWQTSYTPAAGQPVVTFTQVVAGISAVGSLSLFWFNGNPTSTNVSGYRFGAFGGSQVLTLDSWISNSQYVLSIGSRMTLADGDYIGLSIEIGGHIIGWYSPDGNAWYKMMQAVNTANIYSTYYAGLEIGPATVIDNFGVGNGTRSEGRIWKPNKTRPRAFGPGLAR